MGDDQIWYCVNKLEGSGGMIHDKTVLVGEVTETHLNSGAATCAFIPEKRKTFRTVKKYKIFLFKKYN
jgi:hypothetical protein